MIIAVDFDGILCESRFPAIGKPNYGVISLVRQLMDEGHEVVLWTSRAGDRLAEAVMWCEDYGLHFCAVNENAPSNAAQYLGEYPTPSPKIYADLYLEDKVPWFIQLAQLCGDEAAIETMVFFARELVDAAGDGETKEDDDD